MMTFIGMYGGPLVVGGLDMFNANWKVQTPPEFRPWGWTTLDMLVCVPSSPPFVSRLR